MMLDGREELFRCASNYMGGEWYDFCLVKFTSDDGDSSSDGSLKRTQSVMTHAARILGMFKHKRFMSDFDDGMCAVVHTSKDPVTFLASIYPLPDYRKRSENIGNTGILR